MCIRCKHHLLAGPFVGREILSYLNILAKLHSAVVSQVSLTILMKFTPAELDSGAISVGSGQGDAQQTISYFQLSSAPSLC